MTEQYDVVVVGAGIAGASAALHLSGSRRVLVLEAHAPASGASGAAAGLVNPLMGRRARVTWRADEALEAFREVLDLAGAPGLFTGPVLRPAAHADQAGRFREAAAARPDLAAWLTADEARARCPALAAGAGALLVRPGGAVDVAAFCRALLGAATRRGAEVRTGVTVTGWDEPGPHVVIRTAGTGTFGAEHVVLAVGDGFRAFPELAGLALHRIKGQTIRVEPPAGLVGPDGSTRPHLAGRGYLVRQGDTLVLGSTYEHAFDDLRPTEAATRQILRKVGGMVPAVREALVRKAMVREALAGVRVTVPGTRLPMVGPLPGRRRVWLFGGLGSKGLLTGPLLARMLPRALEDPSVLPPEVRVRTGE